MAKLLPVTGIVAAVLMVVVALADITIFQPILPVLAILVGVFAILEARRANLVMGIVLIVAGAVLAFLAIPGGVNTEGGGGGGSSADWSAWFALLGGFVAIAAVAFTRRTSLSPPWLWMASIALGIVALGLAAWKVDSLGSAFADVGNAWPIYLAVVLLLGAGYACVAALRGPEPAAVSQPGSMHHSPPPPAVMEQPAAASPKKAAKKKSAK